MIFSINHFGLDWTFESLFLLRITKYKMDGSMATGETQMPNSAGPANED